MASRASGRTGPALRVQVTRDGGKPWQNVTPKELPEWGLVSTVEPSPQDAATAYVGATRYKLDDFRPYVYKTSDYGRSWKKIVTGIPETHFVRVVREDPARRGLLFAGTEFGMYVSFDDGASWQTLQLNLPVAPIHDLTLKDHDLAAATHGRAFWVLDDITPLEQLSDEIAHADRHLFTPRDAVRFRGPSFVPARSLTGLGTNPPNGATVYFYVKQKPEEDATLDFLDARDSLVRRFSSRPKEPADSLKAEAGLNRFVWDLRYADAHRFKGLVFWAGNTRGPLAVPGSYKDPLNFPIKVNNRLASLGGVVASADAPPTDQSYQVFDQLAAELQGYLDRLKTIVETDVPAFNRTVREQDIPAVLGR